MFSCVFLVGDGMNISSNFAVALALGDLNKNNKQINKLGKRAATGMLLNSAADGSSDYSISEKMQARIRCLNQDDQNVKTGTDLLQLAEGAIQSQINILKTVKAKVIEANNDTCTDSDRAIIQKEIDQAYEEIDDIAYETNYNGLRLLNGDFAKEKIGSWLTLDKSTTITGSDSVNLLLDDDIPTLDGIEGPFALFTRWTSGTAADKDTSAPVTKGSETFSGGKAGDRTTYELDLSKFTSVDDFEGMGLFDNKDKDNVYGFVNDYVLSNTEKNPDKSYGVKIIELKGSSTVEDVALAIAESYNKNKAKGNLFTAKAEGKKVIFESILDDTKPAIDYGASSQFYPGGSSDPSPKTGLFTERKLSGGVTGGGGKDKDDPFVGSETASLQIKDFKDAEAGSGITIYYGGYTICVSFRDDDGGFTTPTRNRNNIYGCSIGKYAADDSLGRFFTGMDITYKDGLLDYKAPSIGSGYNNNPDYYVKDGIDGGYWDDIKGDLSSEIKRVKDAKTSENRSTIDSGMAGVFALIEESAGKGKDPLEKFIEDFKNTRLYFSSGGLNYEFIDKKEFEYDGKKYNTYDSLEKNSSIPKENRIDLDEFRKNYKDGLYAGKSVSVAAAEFLKEKIDPKDENVKITSAGGIVTKVEFISNLTGDKGAVNGHKLVWEPTNLRSYKIDTFPGLFTKKLSDDTYEDVPAEEVIKKLDGGGFRAYCASDSSQWFNFIFSDGPVDKEKLDEKPKGDTGSDIKSIYIDISGITDAESLITTIYDQADEQIKSDPSLDHYMRLAVGTSKNADGKDVATSLILYDNRNYPIRPDGVSYPWYQEQGAKIAEGVTDDVVWGERDLYVKRLVIHHTDRSSANIKLDIPNTDLKSIYGMDTDYEDLRRYNVLTKSNRKRLLGTKEKEGALDYGINYLTGAQTLIGAQVNHLKFANENITTQHQYTTAAESQIRDADMAHTMTEYTKANVLGQASQTMLAQANQNSSQVLSLLQG